MKLCEHAGCEKVAALRAYYAPYRSVWLCVRHFNELVSVQDAEREFFARCGVTLEQEEADVPTR